MMKISAVIVTGCLMLAFGAWTPDTSAQQTTSQQAPSTGGAQVGSGSGVNTDPGTQGTSDRAGQTPRPAGTAPGQPSGSLGGDQNTSGGTRGTTDKPKGKDGSADKSEKSTGKSGKKGTRRADSDTNATGQHADGSRP